MGCRAATGDSSRLRGYRRAWVGLIRPAFGDNALGGARRARPSDWLAASFDLVAALREHVPAGAELVEALTPGLTGRSVGDVVVEGMTVVGHLGLAVRAPGSSQLVRCEPVAGSWSAGHD